MARATLILRDAGVGRALIQRNVQLSSAISGMLSELHWRDELVTTSSIKEITDFVTMKQNETYMCSLVVLLITVKQ